MIESRDIISVQKLELLRKQYATNLPERVEDLWRAVKESHNKPKDSDAVSDAIMLAHRLAGTAGTYGFHNAADLAAFCEAMLTEYRVESKQLPTLDAIQKQFDKVRRTLPDKASDIFEEFSQDAVIGTKGKILVIDDDDEFLMIIRAMLEGLGYEATTTADTIGIADYIDTVSPDLILLDVEMRKTDGFAVCRQIRNNKHWNEIPIIFLTSRNSSKDRVTAFHAGGDDFLNKPVVVEELQARIAIRIEKSRLIREQHNLLQQIEKQRDSLLAMLDQLQIGTLLVNAHGQIEFLSSYCNRLGLKLNAKYKSAWETVLPLEEAGRLRFIEQRGLPSSMRKRFPLTWRSGGHEYFVSCEILDVPGSESEHLVCLTDQTEVHRLRQELDDSRYGRMVGKSDAIQELYQLIEDVSSGDWTVLIEGETGVGKELVAHSIHAASPRRDGPFIAVNSAGLSESLLASQLFGHRKGAFTGAVTDQQGFFEAAEGGTLFLDEIGDLPAVMQASLLRVLQEKEITRLGESRSRKVDVRILAATHKDLASEVQHGRFRQDLLYRLRVARIYVPALRERKADIPILSEEFITDSRIATPMQGHKISNESMKCMLNYDWPGNVRELKAAIDYASIRSRGERIEPEHLPPEVAHSLSMENVRPAPLLQEGDQRDRILAALVRTNGNRLQAAKLLGISRATFYRHLDKLGITLQE